MHTYLCLYATQGIRTLSLHGCCRLADASPLGRFTNIL